jgi:hypothetical protein
MPKPLLEDMVKKKKVIRRLPPKVERVESIVERHEYDESPVEEQPKRSTYKPERRRRGKGLRFSLWFLATISVIFLFFAVSFVFSKAVITINPKVKDITLNNNFTAEKDTSTNAMPFDLVVISGEEHKDVEATTQKDVLINATGKALLYNKSATSQLLAVGTKLEGSNGKLYKIDKKVTIPASKTGTPGKVETNISAVSPGEEYNSKPLDFKIPSFKGTPKYDSMYGRSSTDLTGGLKGKFGSLTDAEKSLTLDSLKSTLNDKLVKKATDQIPAGFILFKDAVFLNTEDAGLSGAVGSSTVPVGLKGTLYGFLLNEKELTKKIAASVVEDYDGSDVYVQNIKDLKFSLVDKNISFADVKNINFNLSGKTKLIWRFDENKFKSGLMGEKKSVFNQLLAKYPNINSADLVIEPFWRGSFPDKDDKIQITVNYPK